AARPASRPAALPTLSLHDALPILDAPSGTALALADAINETQDPQYAYCFDRSQERKPREKREIGISAVRGGTIVGEHEVLFAGEDRKSTRLNSSHVSSSYAVFCLK